MQECHQGGCSYSTQTYTLKFNIGSILYLASFLIGNWSLPFVEGKLQYRMIFFLTQGK